MIINNLIVTIETKVVTKIVITVTILITLSVTAANKILMSLFEDINPGLQPEND